MNKKELDEIIRRSLQLRKKYHELEVQHHGGVWTVEEDALAYLTDAGLIGRNIMSQQQRWPKSNSEAELEHKLGENIWWLIVLADRSGIHIGDAIERFLSQAEMILGTDD